ncbi:tyrosine-type recombinase/integrase [uncultured Sneathiella sp.]|uniref:tyrosine-type recombinase/integrase n=1 Tax=uncultured Sneathiella sp. TaxID=879315 RepID=UPI0030EB681C|tara:strand:+ start:17531 stop:18511 length:981 start_codon:yes stop_codon:yes gene_type:complete
MHTFIDDFALYFRRQGKSPETIKAYQKKLRQFCRERHITEISEINRESINSWISCLRDRKLTDGTIALHLWAIKAFLTWLKKEQRLECYTFDIFIPKPKEPDYVEFLEPDELELIFSLIDTETLDGMRLRTYIEVMINTGMRPSETLNLKITDIVGSEISIVGKGNKRRRVYFNDRARHWIKAYCDMRRDNCPALFVTNPKYSPRIPHAITLDRMEEQFRAVFRLTGLRKRVTLHTLRHTYATTLLANGCPTDYVARLLGHSKVETTRRHYLSIQHKHARKAHFRFLSYDADAPMNYEKQSGQGAPQPHAPSTHTDPYNPNPRYLE